MNKKLRLLLIVPIILMSGLLSYGQQKVVFITDNYEDESLTSILKSYKKKYGVRFAYDADLLRGKRVTAEFNNIPIEQVVQHITSTESLGTEWVEHTCIIKPIDALTDFAISGIINDEDSGEVLPFANIFLKNTKRGTLSNSDGFFTLTGIPTDTSWIVVNYIGYAQSQFRVKDVAKTYGIKLSLQSHVEVLEEVVIDEISPMLQTQENIGQMTINPSKLSSLPSLGEQDVFRTLQLLPGVSGTDETSSGLVIRNNAPDQNLILLDGFSLYHIDHFYGIFSAINSNAIKDIQIYKGGFLPKYGGRSGAIVDIIGKSGNSKKHSGSVGVNMISSNVVYEGPISKRMNIFLAARRSYTDIIETSLYKNLFDNIIKSSQTDSNNDEIDLSPDFFFYDFNGKINYRPSDKDIVSFSTYQGKDKLDLDTSEEYDSTGIFRLKDDIDWGNRGYGIKWGRQWSKRYYTNLQMGYSKYFSRRNANNSFKFLPIAFNGINGISGVISGSNGISGVISGSNDGFIEVFSDSVTQNNDVSDVTLRLSSEWRASDKHLLTFGTDFNQNRVSLTTSYSVSHISFSEGSEIRDNDNSGWQWAAYFQDQLQLTDRLSILLGIRGMYYNVTKQSFIEPRANLTYRVTDEFGLKAGWGKNNQVINRVIREDVYASNPDFWILTDGKFIPSVSSSSAAVGFTYERNNFLVDVEGYIRNTDGILEYVPRLANIQPGAGMARDMYYEGANAAKGIEVLLQKKTGKHSGWLSYTWSKSENNFNELNGGDYFPSQYDQRHELKLVNIIEVGNWELSANWIYGSGRPFTPEFGEYTLTLLDGSQVTLVNYSNINADRLPAYHRLDLSVTYNFKIGSNDAQIGGAILNLYGRENVKYRKLVSGYFDEENEGIAIDAMPSQQLRDVKLLGFTPNIYFNIKF